MVKVSVGVTIYNVEEYLKECLDSIMSQTFKNFEVIMVDDGSTDNSFIICQEYVARDSRFKLIHQANKGKGQAGAKNACLKHMTGEFITWVDSDDVIDNNYLERLLEVQTETGADIVRCVRKHIRDGDVYYIKGYEDGFTNTDGIFNLTLKDALDNALDNHLGTIEFWGELIPRKLYKGLILSQGVIHEDQGNKFKLYLRSKKNVLLLEQLYAYRIRQGSIMDVSRKEKDSLSERLYDLKVCTFNWNKLMYYVDIANYKVDETREACLKRLDRMPAEVNLSEDDAKIYREVVNRYKQKLQRYWNIR
ncbi:glycosyltransferase [Lactobacillus salivarius]|uniref:Glycosyltransferase n=1 Tax=Ligilactobacillus salivarius TaxID=1624 RepID=A0A6A8LZ09_9LACO|nr:glycosyltransferase [Ligilactobacillus salivarius]MSE07029.1 glycosyltransferase [Ligilactobacillus salivarius]MSE07645.1 glycosyltransferase [Ligilactobacillus salivarius]